MKRKITAIILMVVLVLALAMPMAAVGASPATIWTIGTLDGLNTEFIPDGPGETSYTVGASTVTDFPGFLHTANIEGPQSVEITFTTTMAYGNVSLAYHRMGGETDELWFDGVSLGTCAGPSDPYPSTLYTFPVPGLVVPGTHTIKIEVLSGGDGRHWIDYLELTGDPFTLDKSMASTGDLGETITVTLVVENPSTSTLTVKDMIPDGLKYIPGSLEIDGSPPTEDPEVVGNTISTSIPPGTHTITFDVQVVEVQYEDVDRVNTAELYGGDGLLASDSVEITLHPYEGFEKTVEIVAEEVVDGIVSVGELVHWDMTITVPNNVDWDIIDAVLKDNLGGELGMAGDEVKNDLDNDVDEDLVGVHAGDLSDEHNTIPDGKLTVKTPGKSNKVHFWITGIAITASDPDLVFVLGVFTDYNPGKGKDPGIHSYSTDGTYELNSGAVLKFTDPVTGFLLSAHTGSLSVTVVP